MILPSELQLEGFSFIYAFFQDFFLKNCHWLFQYDFNKVQLLFPK